MYRNFIKIAVFVAISKISYSQVSKSNIRDSSFLFSNCLSEEDSKKIFVKMEVDAYFPSGYNGWYDFLNNNLDYDLIKSSVRGGLENFRDTILFKFIVTKEGNLCGLDFLNNKTSILINPIIRLLSKSPNWIPASNGGRVLNSYRTLKIEVCYNKGKETLYIPRDIASYNVENH